MNPQVLLIIGIVVLAIFFMVLNYQMEKKRREAIQTVAQQLGFQFSPDKDYNLASQYEFLDHMHSGDNRYTYNILSGASDDGSTVRIFDYHYETHSTDSKGNRSTSHHYRSIYTVILPKSFPELNIKPEGFFSKIGQALGFDDIDFESLEFSNRYVVKSADKKFAYDFCNAQMIDFLLQQELLIIEVESKCNIAMTFENKLSPNVIIPNYQRLQKIRSLMPNYLFSN